MFMGEHVKDLLSQSKKIIGSTASWLNKHKYHVIKSVLATAGAVGIFTSVVWLGNDYVRTNTHEVFHVFHEDEEIGVVSDPAVIEKFILSKVQKLEADYPDAQMILNADKVTYEAERAFKIESDDEAAIQQIDEVLVAKAIGVEIRIDGKLIGIVKDQEAADYIFSTLQQKYLPVKQERSEVVILSFNEDDEQTPAPSQTRLETIEFVEDVQVAQIDIKPGDLVDPESILEYLDTGDVKPSNYTVKKGDTISQIAREYEVTIETIYTNNPWIENDKLQIGDVLDLTVVHPLISVRTVESYQELMDVHYETEYELDNTLRVGRNVTVREGVPGKKIATFLVTKVNGFVFEEEITDEDIVEEPISAIVRRGTMVVKGEGTGSFSWPVKSAKISSGYGNRWGRLHAGTDFTSRNRDILAADNGTVTTAGYHRGYGNYVIVDHKNGYKTLYAHLSKLNTTKGKIVEKGEKIGVMGSTGHSTGIHLHFEIHKNNKPLNPMSYLKR